MKTYINPKEEVVKQLITRPQLSSEDLDVVITEVFNSVKEHGDDALIEYTLKFDGVRLAHLQVSDMDIDDGISKLDPLLRTAIDLAYNNIVKFHQSQILNTKYIETTKGVKCWQAARAISKVGLYIPGGTAPLFSTVLMLGVPAQVAGCQEMVICTPPLKNGDVHPAVLYSAQLCGIRKIIKVGGAQAIAAMTIGTETIPSVYKIFGPGNQYVTAAKMKAMTHGVAIDLPAGPSELVVYADVSSDPVFIAADLLSQAEHGIDSQVVLVTTDKSLVKRVDIELEKQLNKLPRKEIARQSMCHAFVTVHDSFYEAFEFINDYAPEHLIIASDFADDYVALIQNAGSVFVGHMTSESAGDYASGTNHTLPTAGYAKSYSGVSLDSFVKKITFQKISNQGLQELGPAIITMAEHELLQGHANAIKVRIAREKLNIKGPK